MPVGVNAYLFAAGTKRSEEPVSAAIALSTPLSAFTVTGVAILVGLLAGQP
jgi:predicted permease